MNRTIARIYQTTFALLAFFIRWKQPKLIVGANTIDRISELTASFKCRRWLVVTDKGLSRAGIVQTLIDNLEKSNIHYDVFDDILPNPDVDVIEQGYQLFQSSSCDGLIALGGGSVIDAAKAIGIRNSRPKTPLSKLRGLLKVLVKLPPIIAIPTTAGTGSEVTIAAVISDHSKNTKYAIIDPHLIPQAIILDPTLIVNLPPYITSSTGMDALTHAIESFIGYGPKFESKKALQAVKLIEQHLVASYSDSKNLVHRQAMLQASYLAGQAFTRDYVGNVHAVAHALGAYHNTPHGLANAIALPIVLEVYGKHINKKLAKLHDSLWPGMKLSIVEKSSRFIDWIRFLNKQMAIPNHLEIKGELKLDAMVIHALKEANPTYPVPVIWGNEEFTKVIMQVVS